MLRFDATSHSWMVAAIHCGHATAALLADRRMERAIELRRASCRSRAPARMVSSACYIALPPSIGNGTSATSGQAGWLRFGRPGVKTLPLLDADHYVKPRPGLLVLFPAYMWHGVEPFESEQPRLSVAFDVYLFRTRAVHPS